jgi:hypothetical protein
MLKQLHLKNFKSFAADAEPIPFAPVTILVGANASGKSNVFDAMRFLQGIGMGFTVPEIFVGKRVGGQLIYPGMRGGVEESCFAGTREFSARVIAALVTGGVLDGSRGDTTPARCHFDYQVDCEIGPELRLREHFRADPGILEQVSTDNPPASFTGRRSVLSELVDDRDEPPATRFYAGKLLVHLREMRFLEVRPGEMRKYVPAAADELGSHGENLSAVVRRICRDPEQKTSLLHWLSALCVPELTDITFDETKTGDVLVQLVEGGGKDRVISARSLSDGTLRFFGLLAAMFTAPEGSLFLLEEIENGLHPTRVHLLVQLLEQFAEFRNLQIIATTHSSQVLLSLSDEAMRDAVLFARHEEAVGTVVSRLGDLPYFEEVIKESHIDQLFNTGWMEFAV